MDCYGYHDKVLQVDLSMQRACVEHAEQTGDGLFASTMISNSLLKKNTPSARVS